MADERFEERLRGRAANMRALAQLPGASGPLRVWVELPVDDADRLADLVAAVREEGRIEEAISAEPDRDRRAELRAPLMEVRVRRMAALAALDEAGSPPTT